MKKYFLYCSIALVIFALTLFLKDFVREKLIIPILDIVQIIEELPQVLFWSFLIIIVMIFAAGRLKGLLFIDFPVRNKKMVQSGKIEYLADLIKKAHHGNYFRNKLSRYLVNLAIAILVYRERSTPEIIRERLCAGTLNVSPKIQDHLKAVLEGEGSIFRKRGRRFVFFNNEHHQELDAVRVIEFMEEQLEIESDRK